MMDEKSLTVVALVVMVLWLFAAFRWRVKAGLWALGVLAVAVVAIYPPILPRWGYETRPSSAEPGTGAGHYPQFGGRRDHTPETGGHHIASITI